MLLTLIFASTTIITLVYIILNDHRLRKKYRNIDKEIEKKVEAKYRAGKSVFRGALVEELLPFFKGFEYNMSDFKFMAAPIDYIGFCGMSEAREDQNIEIEKIVFADVKSNTATLSPIQKKIKKAVQEGRVVWETFHVDSEGKLSIIKEEEQGNKIDTSENYDVKVDISIEK